MLNSKGLFALKSALLAGAAVVAFGGVAARAEDKKDEKVEKVTVTGTRIKQRDFTSVSPLATVNSKEIALTGTVNTEQLINTLPQIIPGVTITSNNPSLNGFATADLRGLGPGRTLILINGRRANPSSAGGSVDLNTIPASLIERVEVISGGASATYGADAVAGAINFILKDNFEGIQLDTSYEQAEDGVAPAWVADGILGGKFDGDRGSVELALQYYNRQAVTGDKRFFSRTADGVLINTTNGRIFPSNNPADLNATNAAFFGGGSATAPWGSIGGFSLANITTVFGSALDANCRAADGVQSTGGTIRFRTGGGIAPFQSCAIPSDLPGTPDNVSDRYDFAQDNFLILGNERVNAVAFGKYDILPDGLLTAFVDTNFTNSRSTQQLAATPATGLIVKYDLDPTVGNVVVNPYVTGQPQLLQLASLQFPGALGLDNRTFVLNMRTTQVGNRFGDIETNAFGMHDGLRGTIPSIDWDWEIYHAFARNTTTVKNNNNIGKTAMEQLLNACETTSLALQAAPITALPNCPFPTNTGPGGQIFTPTATANNPLGVFSLSPAMINFVRVNSTDVITYEQSVISANATGDVIDLWGEGPISAALGFEYREESLDNRVDPFKNAGDIIGFNAAKSIAGRYDVYELYGEVNVPLLTDETLFKKLEVVAGYRKSDYSTGAGITETWKYGAEWSPFDWLTFRGIQNHAVKAPSAFQLFRAGDQNFPSYTDPCNGPTPVAGVAACTAWFAQFGAVYNAATFVQPNAQVQSFLFGSPTLTPEIADTLTYGLVFNPDWWPVGRLGLSVDRYQIDLDNQIGQRSVAQILNGCRDAIIANGNVYPVGNQFCDAITRDPAATATGAVGAINQGLGNFPGVTTYSGVDVNLRWGWDMENDIGVPGTLGVASLYSWVDEAGGSQGQFIGSIGGIIPENKAATSFTYDLSDLSLLLRWTYVGGVVDNVFGFASLNGSSNAICAAGPSAACAASGGFFHDKIRAYNTYDIGGKYSVTDDIDFSFGIDNIFDKQPPIWAGAVGNGQFNTDGSTYDQLGRTWRLGLKWKH